MTPPAPAPDRPALVVGIGASAGGVEALTALVRALPADLHATVLVVLHVPSTGSSALAQILDRAGPLPAVAAQDGDPVLPGVVYVAPPDRHLVVDDGALRLLAGPREHGHRPAVDPTLMSVAAYGEDAVGVILSGTRDDGTRGMSAIADAGGTTLVQDPAEALFDGMVRSVQAYVSVDAALPVAALAARLGAMATTPSPAEDGTDMSETILRGSSPDDDRSATRYTCPDCGGALWRHEHGPAMTLKCSVGHAYSPESFDGEQGRDVESALWAAARLLGDRHALLVEMAVRADEHGHDRSATAFRDRATEIERAAGTIRGLIEDGRLPLAAVTPDLPLA